MVGVDDQHGVVPQLEFVHGVQDAAQRGVAHRQQGGVLQASVFDLLGGLQDLLVVGPVEVRAGVVVRVELLVAGVAEEGLVRVEGLDLQEPAVLGVVGAQELQAGVEGAGLRVVGLVGEVGAVDPVLPPALHPQGLEAVGDLGVGDLALPGVPLLAAEELEGAEAAVVGGPAVLPVVLVVGGQMGVDAVVLQQFGHRVVERLQRAPAAVQEVVAAGVQLPAGRHAGHAPGVAVVEGDRALGEPGEVRRVDPVSAVGRQEPPVQRVEHDHDGLHAEPSSICTHDDSRRRPVVNIHENRVTNPAIYLDARRAVEQPGHPS